MMQPQAQISGEYTWIRVEWSDEATEWLPGSATESKFQLWLACPRFWRHQHVL